MTDCAACVRDHRRPTTASDDLRVAIEKTGYYPEVVADGVDAAVAGEQVVSFLRAPRADDRPRRGAPAPHRGGADAEPADPRPHRRARAATTCCPSRTPRPRPRRSGSSSVRSVVVNRMVANPAPYAAAASRRRPRPCSPSAGAASAGSTSSRPPAPTPSATPTTATPACSPPTTSRCGSQRGRRRAPRRSPRCSPSPRRCPPAPSGVSAGAVRATGFVEPAYGDRSLGDVLPAVAARPRRRRSAATPTGARAARRRRRTSCSSSTGSAPSCWRAPRARRAVPRTRCWTAEAPGTAGVPVDDRDQPDLARHRR